MDTTEGTLLGGRVRYAQPARGYRTGIEPVLLAAVVPAVPGQAVLEAGTGAGAALLCLATRVPGLVGTGIERDPAMAALARRNCADNAVPYTVLTADIAVPYHGPPVDHALANPPWHDPTSTLPPGALRAAATHRASSGLAPWVHTLAAALRPGGTLTLILPVTLADAAGHLLHRAALPSLTLVPLWPRAGQPAKLVLLQATGGPAGTRTTPGLVLHDGPGYTAAAEAVLRHAQALVP